jgi:DNA polymerase III sliding clamp (beta) subunit (PCNA family)
LPILANVLLRKTGPRIEFTTSDLEIQVRTNGELGGDDGNLNTTVGARKLIDILRSLPADQLVTLSATQHKLTLQAGKSRFTLQTLSRYLLFESLRSRIFSSRFVLLPIADTTITSGLNPAIL